MWFQEIALVCLLLRIPVIAVLLFDRKQEAREYACLSNAAAPAASKPTTATSTVGILFDIIRLLFAHFFIQL